MKDGHIVVIHLLDQDPDDGRVKQARELFDTKGRLAEVEGFEVWDGADSCFAIRPV
jgi:hypothetical protein